ncbi:MAG: hypothetical protein ABI813_14715 [Bacteroidota bacterium]
MKRILTLLVTLCLLSQIIKAQTVFSDDAGIYSKMLADLKTDLTGNGYHKTTLDGKERTIFVGWIRDHVHTMKAHKYWAKDLSSYLDFFMGRQSPKGMYYDYVRSYKNRSVGEMYFANVFDPQFFFIDVNNQNWFFRMPIEADVEYLVIEGVYTYWKSSGDTAFIRKWLPTMVKGMKYEMSDPLRWSSKNLLVKRPYSIDTWDYTAGPAGLTGTDALLIHIGNTEKTPKGIMEGDNSGMFQACKQLSEFFTAIGKTAESNEWNLQGDLFRDRLNRICWNGKFYSHFVPEEPVPAFIKTDPINSISLSNTYTMNRGAPTNEMSASIIKTYQEIYEKTKDKSIASWYGIYPFIEPDFGGSKVGFYMNGAILPLVGGELTKAAFHNGYEYYAVEELKKLDLLLNKNNRKLPGCLNFDGTSQSEEIPAVWGQAAFVSALVEGLAGVVDKGVMFNDVEISPRWYFAGVEKTTVDVGYNGDGNQVKYQYNFNKQANQVELITSGKFNKFTVRVPVPASFKSASATINGQKTVVTIDKVNDSRYAVVNGKQSKNRIIVTFK